MGKYVVDILAFESVALPCLSSAANGKQPQLLLVDEVGKMEAMSDKFVEAIEQTLATSASRGRVTLMVVAMKGTGIIAACKARNDSSSFTLSAQSRDTLTPTAITEKLRCVVCILASRRCVMKFNPDVRLIRSTFFACVHLRQFRSINSKVCRCAL